MKILEDKKKIAIYYKDKVVSYKELILKIKKLTKISDLKEKSNIMIYMENRPEYLYSFFSIWNSKATAVCIDASSTAEELSYYIENSETTKIITSKEQYEKVKKALEILKIGKEIIVVDEINFDEIEIKIGEKEMFVEAPMKEEVALILYTSGTTGKPKGVMLTFDNLLANMEALDIHKMYDENDITIALLPLHHILPLLGTGILPLIYSATIVFLENISSTELLSTMKKYKVSMLIGVPRLWEMIHKNIMNKINSKKITKYIFKIAQKINSISLSKKIFKKVSQEFGGNLKIFVSGGSKLNEKIAADFYTLGIKICEGYGMTETSPMISFTPMDKIIPGCAGEIIKDVEVKIAEDSEILVRGRNVMKGYYNNPKATKEIIKNGWLHTGDLGYLDGKSIFVTGRKKDMIVLPNGKNINPIEIEEKISSLTDLISEAVVLEFKSILTLVVYPDYKKINSKKIVDIYDVLKNAIVAQYNKNSFDYKKILDVKIVNQEFPKTKIGKIKRFLVKDLIEEKKEKKRKEVEPIFEEYTELKKFLFNLKGEEGNQNSHIELDLKLDSLDIVELLSFLEVNFGIKEEDLIFKYPTLIELANYIKANKDSVGNKVLTWKEIINEDTDLKLPSSNIFSRFLKIFLAIIFNSYIRLKIKGKENLSDKRVIYVGNHQSFLDGFLFEYAIGNKISKNNYFLATEIHFKSMFKKKIADLSNIVLVEKNKDVSEVIKTLAYILKKEKSITIFPEGLRSRDGNMNEFKKTFAILAKELNVDIQPFVLNGAYKSFPYGSKFPKPAKIEINFLKRIENTVSYSYENLIEKSFNLIEKNLKK